MTLTFSQVSYTYAEGTAFSTTALEGVDLVFEQRGVTLVLGATGSGKSTLLRLAAGLLAPTCGSVTYGGAPVVGPLADASRPVGLVFQSPESQLFAETVAEDVAFGPRNQGLAEDAVERAVREALVAVDLDPEHFGARSPFTLSGGEARRVALAGVLAMSPALLLFDEPTAGLDAGGRAAVKRVVCSAAEERGTVVVTHDAEEFLGVADRVVLLRDGALTFAGSATELIARPGHFSDAGLRVPEVLRAQVLASEAGHALTSFEIDPGLAAGVLAGVRRPGS